MYRRTAGLVLHLAGVLLLAIASSTPAADAPDCGTFGWNMTHELSLFADTAKPISAAVEPRAAPRIDADVAYSVRLRPRAGVAFAHAPGKDVGGDAGAGGLLLFRPAATGAYRITLDAGMWIDVVKDGELIESTGFRGRQPCGPIHKSVGWKLAAGADVLIQISGPAADTVRLTITRAAAGDE
jgi:hypothetical protein